MNALTCRARRRAQNRKLTRLLPLLLLPALSGCGSNTQDYGAFSRSTGGDLSSGYGGSLSSRGTGSGTRTANGERGTYSMIETAFQLASVPGDPFDYEKVNVQVTLRKPDNGTVAVPAFFDGGTTWRMRFTPNQPGTYAVVDVRLNHEIVHEEKLEPKEWAVKGDTQPGFVRVDRGDKTRFVFDNGGRYYPLGHNQAWQSGGLPAIPNLFVKMHDAGENWSRVWMDHWDGKNLDWSADKTKQVKIGQIDFEAAKRWDAIVESAGKNSIYFQMTLQHHGQYATQVDPNWNDNPYNVKNGGFLKSPEAFFTDPQARTLTKRKLYYIMARWGYSPNIMAWELFNEVEGTDAMRSKMTQDVAMWHREMSLFLQQYDGYHHLITTSSQNAIPPESPIWETVDYVQIHTYPSDIITALDVPDSAIKKAVKPAFVGEFGPQNLQDTQGITLHKGLWTSLMRSPGGAAEYWAWDVIEKNNLYSHFAAVSGFLTASALANQGGLVSTTLPVTTAEKGTLRFGPGSGWGNFTQNEFVVSESGTPAGISALPAYLQGTTHRDMMPQPLKFQVAYPKAGTFAVTIGQVSKAGAKLALSVDGGKPIEKDYPTADANYKPEADAAVLSVTVPTGAHTVTLENTGNDWAVVRQFALSGYAPALTAMARVGSQFAAAWVYQRDGLDAAPDASPAPTTGKITLTGLKPGRYRATWWDTQAGKSLDAADVTVEKGLAGAQIDTPPISRDAALYVVKAAAVPVRTAKHVKPKQRSGTRQ